MKKFNCFTHLLLILLLISPSFEIIVIKRTILSIGETGVGKSTFSNFLANKNAFKTSSKSQSQTKTIQIENNVIYHEDKYRIELQIIDSPGVFDLNNINEDTFDSIAQVIKQQKVNHIILFLNSKIREEQQDKRIHKWISTFIKPSPDNFSIVLNFYQETQECNFQKNNDRHCTKIIPEFLQTLISIYKNHYIEQITNIDRFSELQENLLKKLIEKETYFEDSNSVGDEIKSLFNKFNSQVSEYLKQIGLLNEKIIEFENSFLARKKEMNLKINHLEQNSDQIQTQIQKISKQNDKINDQNQTSSFLKTLGVITSAIVGFVTPYVGIPLFAVSGTYKITSSPQLQIRTDHLFNEMNEDKQKVQMIQIQKKQLADDLNQNKTLINNQISELKNKLLEAKQNCKNEFTELEYILGKELNECQKL